jgi:hypothetical protein
MQRQIKIPQTFFKIKLLFYQILFTKIIFYSISKKIVIFLTKSSIIKK